MNIYNSSINFLAHKYYKYLLLFVYFCLAPFISNAQSLSSGEYDSGLRLAYDSINNKLTGYFENHSGWNIETESSLFSCIFYINGNSNGGKWKLRSYYPGGIKEDLIVGELEVVNDQSIRIVLSDEPGGCGNVQHFAAGWEDFTLIKKHSWMQIRYVATDKCFIYSEKKSESRNQSFIVKDEIVYVSKIEDDWAYCLFFGKVNNSGWIKIADLNGL